ncbi:efflux RND transporter periplasmic adaptor subunit [Halopseudomonas salegens]|uniref:Membrane fusion protein, multidrug efflux system n=1 Tax=Halopseudomonas salegens TaxID=1434072 RepID=A0A1H2ESJ1_9GAMM|nr:efflux RND transporter periplasmic adaptor subunit [Halopseudomonas salegens]SDT98045.1 membrane fusion protein, multidrug efflux system [Halopseudomonas salegens]
MARSLGYRALRPQWLMTACLSLLLVGCGNGDEPSAGGREMPPSAVTLETLEPTTLERVEEYPGRVRGAREVQVRTLVAGVLKARTYNEGSRVERGDVLFQIDPAPFNVQVKQAQAAVANARAERDQAQRDWARANQLFERGALSASERDRARSQLDFALAGLAEAEAELDEAELNLSYTEVKAPISGVTSLEVQPQGSLLELGGLVTTIVQQDPVQVLFALPERDMALLRQAQSEENGIGREVRLLMVDDNEYARTGRIDFTASSIDAATGTVTMRAIFDNPDNILIPGQFARIRLVIQRFTDALFVPVDAVGGNQHGPTVFVVNEELKAELRQVELGPIVAGKRLVRSGLDVGDQLVINGHAGLFPGAPVRVVDDTPVLEGDQ